MPFSISYAHIIHLLIAIPTYHTSNQYLLRRQNSFWFSYSLDAFQNEDGENLRSEENKINYFSSLGE